MERTQIYLDERETAALDRVAAETGRTRSDLIREAVAIAYLGSPIVSVDAATSALELSAGAWKGRKTDGAHYVERLRRGRRLARLTRR
jgi:hypothetical protein